MKHCQAVSTCNLKVKINCCTMCQMKAKDKLQKINGVESVVYDSKGVVTVSGKVNPMMIVKKLEKWGKNAELLSFQKTPKQDVEAATPSHSDKDCCYRCDAIMSDSASDSDDKADDCEVRAAKKSNANITWQSPHLPTNQQRAKSKARNGFFSLFRKKGGGGAKMMLGKPSTADGPPKWQFPNTPMAEYGGPRPYYNPPFEPYPPPVIGMPPSAPSYHPFGQMRPPPPPYGLFNSRPPPKVNPMIHYTSYADNYSYW